MHMDKSISVFVNFTTVYSINNNHNHFFKVTYSLSFCYFLEQRQCQKCLYMHMDKSSSVFVNLTTVYTINNDHIHYFQSDIFPQFLLLFRTKGVPETYIIGLVNTLNPHAMEYN
jgi:hypothetical protein